MAERRMFAKTIVLSDAFLDMPLSARCLYFTLGMLADDDGFVNSPKSIMRQCGACEDDMKLLLVKKFLLSFETGVIVIKHWRVHNYIQKDRYKETKYIDEKNLLGVDDRNIYYKKNECIQNGYIEDKEKSENTGNNEVSDQCIQNVYIMDTQVRLGKDSLGKVSIGENSIVEVVEEEKIVVENSSTPPTPTSPPPNLILPSFQGEQKLYGEYYNVSMTEGQYKRLLGYCLSQELLDEIINEFSRNIETGKEQPYKAHLPNAHYVQLVKYYEYRKKNPDKFRSATETRSRAAEVTDKWYEEMKGRGYGS